MEFDKPDLPGIGSITPLPLQLTLQNEPAESMYKRLVRSVIEFEDNLSNDAEVGFLSSFSEIGKPIILEDIGYYGEDMILIAGSNSEGDDIQIISHYTQLNLALISVKCHTHTPRRIAKYLTNKINE